MQTGIGREAFQPHVLGEIGRDVVGRTTQNCMRKTGFSVRDQ